MNLHYFITFSSRGSGVCRSLFLRTFMVMMLFITGSNGIYAGVINEERSITVDNKVRKYWLYVPASVEGQKNVPVVFSLSTDVVVQVIRMPPIQVYMANQLLPHLHIKKASSWFILKDEMVQVNRIKKTILVTGIMLSEEVRAGKPLEKRMQIQSLSRQLWMR